MREYLNAGEIYTVCGVAKLESLLEMNDRAKFWTVSDISVHLTFNEREVLLNWAHC